MAKPRKTPKKPAKKKTKKRERSIKEISRLVQDGHTKRTKEQRKARKELDETKRDFLREWLKDAVHVDPDTGETRDFTRQEKKAMLDMDYRQYHHRFRKHDKIRVETWIDEDSFISDKERKKAEKEGYDPREKTRIYSETTGKYYNARQWKAHQKRQRYVETVRGIAEYNGLTYHESQRFVGEVLEKVNRFRNDRSRSRRAARTTSGILREQFNDHIKIVNEKLKELYQQLGWGSL